MKNVIYALDFGILHFSTRFYRYIIILPNARSGELMQVQYLTIILNWKILD